MFLSIILCRRRSAWPPGKLLRRWPKKSPYVAFKLFKNHSMLLFDDFVIIFKDPDIVDTNWLNQNQFQGLAWPCKLSYWHFKPWERLNLLKKREDILIVFIRCAQISQLPFHLTFPTPIDHFQMWPLSTISRFFVLTSLKTYIHTYIHTLCEQILMIILCAQISCLCLSKAWLWRELTKVSPIKSVHF